MSHSDFMDCIVGLQTQEDMFDVAVKEDTIPNMPWQLVQIGWQLRLPKSRVNTGPQPEFVRGYDLMTVNNRRPKSWRLVMLKLNWAIYGSSKKFIVRSVSMSKEKSEETTQMWMTTLQELRELMDTRAWMLKLQPLSKHEHLNVCVPDHIEDRDGAPPVVIWLRPLEYFFEAGEKAGGTQSHSEWGKRKRCASGGWSWQRETHEWG